MKQCLSEVEMNTHSDQISYQIKSECYQCYQKYRTALGWPVVCDCGISGQTHFLFNKKLKLSLQFSPYIDLL